MIAKTLAAAALAAGALAAAAAPASAHHGHFIIKDRDGVAHCRYIAEGQTSKAADDPGGHKFHDNVHLGQPGVDEQGTDFDKASMERDRCDVVHEPGR
ncbi:MAG: hypothetical protein ACLGIC_04055 [Acidimicrobiia bacterium]